MGSQRSAASRRKSSIRRLMTPSTRDVAEKGVPFLGRCGIEGRFRSAVAVIAVVMMAAVVGPKGPKRSARSNPPGANPRPEWPFLLAVRPVVAQPPAARDIGHAGFSRAVDCRIIPRSVRFQSGRTGPEPSAGGRAFGRRDLRRARRFDLRGRLGPMVAVMTAWSGEPIPVAIVKDSTPWPCKARSYFRIRIAATVTRLMASADSGALI